MIWMRAAKMVLWCAVTACALGAWAEPAATPQPEVREWRTYQVRFAEFAGATEAVKNTLDDMGIGTVVGVYRTSLETKTIFCRLTSTQHARMSAMLYDYDKPPRSVRVHVAMLLASNSNGKKFLGSEIPASLENAVKELRQVLQFARYEVMGSGFLSLATGGEVASTTIGNPGRRWRVSLSALGGEPSDGERLVLKGAVEEGYDGTESTRLYPMMNGEVTIKLGETAALGASRSGVSDAAGVLLITWQK